MYRPPAATMLARRERSAFSLIELLVVISIIAVLAGMLLPAVGMVRESARAATCSSNLRQFQIANTAYRNDAGYWLPSFGKDSSGNNVDYWLYNPAFIDLLSDGKVTDGDCAKLQSGLYCPGSRPNLGWWAPLMYSYGYNFGQIPSPAKTLNYLPRDRSVVAFMDARDWLIVNWGAISAAYWTGGVPLPEGVYSAGTVSFRHRNKANVVYYDGHVESQSYAELNQFGLWNP